MKRSVTELGERSTLFLSRVLKKDLWSSGIQIKLILFFHDLKIKWETTSNSLKITKDTGLVCTTISI
jgi:hypothetical protein